MKYSRPSEELANELRADVGDISGIHLTGMQVLVASYVQKTVGSIIRPEMSKKEDEYQGKVGLILATGPKAFDDEWKKLYGHVAPKIGDWISFRVYESAMQKVNGVACRQMEDKVVRSIVDHPEMVY